MGLVIRGGRVVDVVFRMRCFVVGGGGVFGTGLIVRRFTVHGGDMVLMIAGAGVCYTESV